MRGAPELVTRLGRGAAERGRAVIRSAAGPSPERRRGLRWSRITAFFVAIGFAAYGFLILVDEASPWVLLSVPVIAVLWRIRILRAAISLPVSVFAVVGFNALWHGLGIDRLPIDWGLLLAVAVFSATTFLCIRTLATIRWSLGASVAISLVVVVGIPALVGAIRGSDPVPSAGAQVGALIDVTFVTSPGAVGRGAGSGFGSLPESSGFDVRYSVATLERGELTWTLSAEGDPAAVPGALRGRAGQGATRPAVRAGADPVLVVIPPRGRPPGPRGGDSSGPGWLELARRAAPAGAPAFALLGGGAPAQLESWQRALSPSGGRAVALERLEAEDLPDLAVKLAIRSASAEQELALAVRFRPILRFDRREPFPAPLEIDEFFASGQVDLCEEGFVGASCRTISSARELTDAPSHLKLNLDRGAAASKPTSTIYVHPVERGQLLLLDYWWYLPLNPSAIGGGAFCGAGLVLPGLTCFDHQSDWEGVTVVLDTGGEEPAPIAVHYAEHEAVTAYRWEDLAAEWADPSYLPFTRGIADSAERPLVFSARGTHASYPTPCFSSCEQVASGRAEQPHDGALAWSGNATPGCIASSCVELVPTRRGGSEPALWNAYPGPWGEQNCRFRYFCDLGRAPAGPAVNHDRYDASESCDGLFSPSGRRLGDDCPAPGAGRQGA